MGVVTQERGGRNWFVCSVRIIGAVLRNLLPVSTQHAYAGRCTTAQWHSLTLMRGRRI